MTTTVTRDLARRGQAWAEAYFKRWARSVNVQWAPVAEPSRANDDDLRDVAYFEVMDHDGVVYFVLVRVKTQCGWRWSRQQWEHGLDQYVVDSFIEHVPYACRSRALVLFLEHTWSPKEDPDGVPLPGPEREGVGAWNVAEYCDKRTLETGPGMLWLDLHGPAHGEKGEKGPMYYWPRGNMVPGSDKSAPPFAAFR